MTSISISSVPAASGSSSQSQGSDSTIAGLKQKLAILNKDLQAALGEATEAGMQKVKAIQMRIQVIQAKLQQLIQQEADKASNKQEKPQKQTVSSNVRMNGQIDVFA